MRTFRNGAFCTETDTKRTLELGVDVICFADEFVLVQHVELFPSGELLTAHHTREAFQVKHLVTCTTYQVVGRDPFRATAALGAVSPADVNNA